MTEGKPTQGSGQPSPDELFVISEQTGLVEARTFAEPGDPAANHRIEQKIHLINALNHLSAAKMYGGATTSAAEPALAERYKDNAGRVAEGAAHKAASEKNLAYQEFSQAVGESALRESGQFKTWEIRRAVDSMFAKFVSKYYVSQDSFKALSPYRKRLEREVRALQAVKPEIVKPAHSSVNRPEQKAAQEASSSTEDSPVSDADKLDTRSRMQAILGDERAGFLPRSNGEKNIVLSYLDYLDNAEYPEGVPNQWFEVMSHLQKYRPATPDNPAPKRFAAKDGVRAVESIVWQIADYYADARDAIRDLTLLQEEIDGVSPRLNVQELDDNNTMQPGLERMIRGLDIEAYVKKGQVNAPVADPLAGTVSRSVDSSQREPGRHKVVYDQYSQPDRAEKKPNLEAYLQEECAGMTVKEVRKSLPAILATEQRRAAFMRARLEDALRLDSHRILASAVYAAESTLLTDVPIAAQ